MERTLNYEIRPAHAYTSSAEKVLQSLERTTDHLQRKVHRLLRNYGLTPTQYSALRALRDGPAGGMTCTDLGTRLVSVDPDITRLLDRLAKQKVVRRRRDARDRRIVLTEITKEGVDLLATIGPLMEAHVRALFEHMAPQRVESLIDLLDQARESPAEDAPSFAAASSIQARAV